jgi:predicted amidohydrolase YtcJ
VDKVQLIVGFGYDNAQLKELRHPTRDDLDAVSSDYPIFRSGPRKLDSVYYQTAARLVA